MPLRVLSVASEMYPFVKTGGLADVVGALPEALKSQEIEVTSFIPGYRQVFAGAEGQMLVSLAEADAQTGAVLAYNNPEYFDREGGPYQGPNGLDYPDNLQRFSAFSRMAAEVALGEQGHPAFDLVHVHDWQGALTIAWLAALSDTPPPTVLTIHNLAFQGSFGFDQAQSIDLPEKMLTHHWLEFYGQINLLKSAIIHASAVTTVSQTYAREICRPENGFGLQEMLVARGTALSGILNGLDTLVWDPKTDASLWQTYNASTVASGKAKNKAHLQQQFGLQSAPDRPLFGLVSRQTTQKGIDLVIEALDYLVFSGGQAVILGSGEAHFEAQLQAKAQQHLSEIAVQIGYDEALAHRIHGASDFFLVPSRFEPCGLTQLSAQRYGTLPIVTPIGGLVDTVIDANAMALRSGQGTGIMLRGTAGTDLTDGFQRAFALYNNKQAYKQCQANAMALDVSWQESAKAYADLYRSLIKL